LQHISLIRNAISPATFPRGYGRGFFVFGRMKTSTFFFRSSAGGGARGGFGGGGGAATAFPLWSVPAVGAAFEPLEFTGASSMIVSLSSEELESDSDSRSSSKRFLFTAATAAAAAAAVASSEIRTDADGETPFIGFTPFVLPLLPFFDILPP